jgi:Spy/CpxP family protein refolding chaperone
MLFSLPNPFRAAAFSCALLFSFTATLSRADDKPAAESKPAASPERGGGGRRGAGMMFDRVKERLKLTDDQAAKVEPILKDQAQQRRDLMEKSRAEGGSEDKLREANQKIENETDAKLTPILTADQLKEWKAMREEMRARFSNGARQRREKPDTGDSKPKE